MIRTLRSAAVVLAGLAAFPAAPALAQEGSGRLGPLEGELDSAARRAAERLAKALEMALSGMTVFVDSLPAYEAPEILPNGDILIRRIPKAASEGGTKPAPGEEGSDEAVEL